MTDPFISSWPDYSLRRTVESAEAEIVDRSQGLYRLTFCDLTNRKHHIQLPASVLQSVVESGASVLGLSVSPQVS